MGDYIESLLQGVDLLIDKRLESVSYDTTIVCTIVDDSEKKNGKYKVTDGSVIYIAYSDQDSYKKGDQIRMSVPMGDFSQKKFISGKYVANENTEPITYISPLETVLNISGNFTNGLRGSILANGPVEEKVLWASGILDEKITSLQENDLYNTVTFAAEFKTLLSNYEIKEGNYGIRLEFLTKPNLKSDLKILRSVSLDSSEMFGNPYLFSIPSPQAKVIKMDTYGIVEAMRLILYQKNNFIDINGTNIPIYDGLPDNIIVSNIALGMGCDLTLLEDNKLQIYTDDSLTFRYLTPTSATNLKEIGLLWFNKDENNRYVGFSDGVYDSDYDELKYLEISKENTRLTTYKGREGIFPDEVSLNLAANIDEATTSIKKAINLINRDLITALRSFENVVSSLSTIVTNIQLLINLNTGDKYLPNLTKNIETNLDLLQKQYQSVLLYGYKYANDTQKPTWETLKKDYHALILSDFNKIKSAVNWLFNTTSSGGCAGMTNTGQYSGFVSVYDTYKIRLEKLLYTALGYLNLLDKNNNAEKNYLYLNKYFPEDFFTSDHETLDSYKAKKVFTAYKEPDLSEYDNKYCIYWYRYEEGYTPPEGETLLPDGWRRMTIHDAYQLATVTAEDFPNQTYYILENGTYKKATNYAENTQYYICISETDCDKINIGLSSLYYYDPEIDKPYRYRQSSITYNKDLQYYNYSQGKYKKQSNVTESNFQNYYVRVHVNDNKDFVHAPKTSAGSGTITRYMQEDLKEEKYIAVLFYNHVMYKSNELEFKNLDVIPDKTTRDKGDILIFEHHENSSDNFHTYAITNYLLDSSDEHKNRRIRCHYDGLLAKDNAFVGGQIFWYVPGSSTMITVDEDDLFSKGFTLDKIKSKIEYTEIEFTNESTIKYIPNKYYKIVNDVYKLATETVKDSSTTYYEQTVIEKCYYKTINAKEFDPIPADAEYEWDKWDFTNGTGLIDNRDFWYKIKPYYQDSAQNNEIRCEFLKKDDPIGVFGEQLFTFGIAGTSGTKYTLAITNATSQIATTASKPLLLKAQLKDFDNNILDFTKIATAVAENEATAITWDFVVGSKQGISGFKTADKNEGLFEIPKNNYGIIQVTAPVIFTGSTLEETEEIEEEAEATGRTRLINLTVLKTIPQTTADYYIQGPTQIIYNSMGTLDNTSMFNVPYKLFANSDIDENAKKDQEISGVTWRIKYYAKQRDGSFRDITNINDSNDKEAMFFKEYMPKIIDNTLSPAPLYLDGLSCYAVVEACIGNTVHWYQPILIMQNRYSSTVLNDWDGSFKIDEKNGTIMGTMFGAGRKTNNNTFEGVLMGDVGVGADLEQDADYMYGMGLYGFHDGAQSFGFNVNGTAFLGKAGNGRILFNGNQGIIASANWFTGPEDSWDPDGEGGYSYPEGGTLDPQTGAITNFGKAGMCIDLENGHIDAYNFRLTSENIYLNSNPSQNDDKYIQIGTSSTDGHFYLQKNGRFFIRASNFELDAWSNGGIYLNSNPSPYGDNSKDEYYIKVGSGDGYKALELRKDGRVRIRGWDSTNSKGFVMNSNPAPGERYFRLGTAGGNEIHFWRDNSGVDQFRIQSTQFYLNAGTDNRIIIDSSGNSNYYFYAGKKDGTEYLQYTKDGNIGIRSNSFRLEAGTKGDTNYLGLFSSDQKIKNEDGSYSNVNFQIGSSNAINTWRIIAGKNFGVTKAGKLYASGANISGNIYADYIETENGKIGGWTVTGSSLNNGSTYLNSDGTIKGAAISGSTISGGSITVGNYFKVSTSACVEMSNSVGFFTMGSSSATNPYVSALNVAGTQSAISFRSSTSITSTGSQLASIGIVSSSGSTYLKIDPANDGLYIDGTTVFNGFIHVKGSSGQTGQIRVQTYVGEAKFLAFKCGLLVGISGTKYDESVYPDLVDE